MSSQFPTDDLGQYLTLSYLHEMKNAEYVTIFFVKTDVEAVFIPSEVVQDGLSINLEKSTKKIHFKQQKNVIGRKVEVSLRLLIYSRETWFSFSY